VQVRLYIRVRLAIGKRVYANPAYAPNGRIKPFYAVIEDKLEHHPEGVYHLRYVKNGKRVWRAVGTDAYAAITAQLKTDKALAAKAGIHRTYVGADGSALTAPDTRKNRKAYPPVQTSKRCSFPMTGILPGSWVRAA